MTQSHLEFRIARGLLTRLDAFCPITQSDRVQPASILTSIAGRVYANKNLGAQRGFKIRDEEVDIINLALRLKSQIDQNRLFSQLKGTKQFDVLKILTLGIQFCGSSTAEDAIEGLSDVDFSLANATLLARVLANERKLFRFVKRRSKDLLDRAGIQRPESCRDLSSFVKIFGLATDIQSIVQISEAFYALKQIAWYLFGSDVLVFMQGLADPNSSFEMDQLSILSRVTTFWSLDTISSRLIVLRSVNGFMNERRFTEQNSFPIASHANLPVHIVSAIKDAKIPPDAIRKDYVNSSDPIESAILFSVQFYRLLDRGEMNKLLFLVRDQHERDSGALAFLDWDHFHDKAPVDWGQNYLLNILLSVVLLSPNIEARFESIEYSYGEGFVTNQIINYVNYLKQQKQGIYHFARNIANMGQRARAAIAAFVLQKSVIEVYAFAFRDKPLASKLSIPIADLEVCHARIRLAYLFRESGTLAAEYCDRIMAEESAFRKMCRFQEVFRNSRIRIDWNYLGAEIGETLDDDFGFFFRSLRRKDSSTTGAVAEIIAKIVAQRICQLTLFDSATSLERSLSNNLRHGVVVPRFLRVFTDAISGQISARPLTGRTNRGWYEATFRNGGAKLFDLEETVIFLIENYQDRWLKVDKDGDFLDDLTNRVASAILKNISKGPSFSIRELITEMIEIQKSAISNILLSSRDALIGSVKSDVEKSLSIINIDVRPLDDRGSSEFLDSLGINLEEAFQQVAGWISLVNFEHSGSMEFDLGDLIDEESNTFIISDRTKSKIKYECYERKIGRWRKIRDIRISGRAFDLFDQLVHNLLSNARKRSGLRNETAILVKVYREEEDLVFWCGNDFAKGQLKEMRKHQTRAKKLVSETMISGGDKRKKKPQRQTHKEGGYGFLKIIDTSERILGSAPSFNFPPLNSDDSQFIVEIRLPSAKAIVL
jgi:hypothetical protein